jgi:hypothetical protein
MHLERIYIQQNFRQRPGDDPFLFKTVGIGVYLKKGESIEEAMELAQTQINDYIQKNTSDPEHNHVEVRDVQVQKTTEDGIAEEIRACTNFKDLEEFKLMAAFNTQLRKAYDDTNDQITRGIDF